MGKNHSRAGVVQIFVPRFQQILIARTEAECEAELLYFTGAQVAGQAVAGRSWLPFHTV